MKHSVFVFFCLFIGTTLYAQSLYPCPPRMGAFPEAQASASARMIAQQTMETTGIGSPRTFKRIPVIIVNFANLSCLTPNIRTAVDSMFNAVDYLSLIGHSPSVAEYFSTQSNGLYRPIFDIYGPVTLSQNYAYYGQNNGSGNDVRPGYMVAEACNLMNDSLDFSLYDADSDGNVDLVYILYAGPPASDGDYISSRIVTDPNNLIWPHYSTLSNQGCGTIGRVLDGKTVNDYEVSAEIDGLFTYHAEYHPYGLDTIVPAGIGIPCHEFGHGMGLSDMYKTCSGTWKTLGMWDIMDYGCYNGAAYLPCNYTSYEKWFMGWATPRELTTGEDVTLGAVTDHAQPLIISPGGTHNLSATNPQPSTFYLLENRQQTGCDYGLPGHGLLIYKVQYSSGKWTSNKINNDANNMGFDLIEADNLRPTYNPEDSENGFNGKEGDAFPTGATDYQGITDNPITNIQENNGVITFQFKGGSPSTALSPMKTGETAQPEKIYHQGHLYIRRGNQLYLLTGNETNLL